jgi:ketosteroid isomerase-like protein
MLRKVESFKTERRERRKSAMNRNRLALPALAALGAALIAGGVFAQQSNVDAVKAVNASLHAALGSLDAKKIEAVWAHENYVTLINPRDKGVSVGWDAVKNNWEVAFKDYAELKLTQLDGPHIHVSGNAAWSTGLVQADVKLKDGNAVSSSVFETDVYEKRDGQWKLVSHAALRATK